MTVTEKASRRVISGFGWTNPLTHTFELENSTHLKVYADDVQLTLGVDYSTTGVGVDSGYSVTITDPLDWSPDVWVLSVEPPINQADDVSLGGVFGARFEESLDAMARRVQRVWNGVQRSWKVPMTTAVGEAPTMDVLAEDHFWKADANGNMIDGGSAADISGAQGYAAAAAASASAAGVSATAAGVSATAAAGSAAAAAASAAGVNLPSISATDKHKELVVKADGSGYDKFRNPFYNVYRYGATGDGVTDDTAALVACQTAANACEGQISGVKGRGVIVVPTGFFKVTGLTTQNSGEKWLGLGGRLQAANGSMTVFDCAHASCVIENMFFLNEFLPLTSIGVFKHSNAGPGAPDCKFINMVVQGGYYGFHGDGGGDSYNFNMKVIGCYADFVYLIRYRGMWAYRGKWDGSYPVQEPVSANIRGVWVNATAYVVGDIVQGADGYIYQCRVAGTSAAAGTGPAAALSTVDIPDGAGTLIWRTHRVANSASLKLDSQTAINVFYNCDMTGGHAYAVHMVNSLATAAPQTTYFSLCEANVPRVVGLNLVEADDVQWHGGIIAGGIASTSIGVKCATTRKVLIHGAHIRGFADGVFIDSTASGTKIANNCFFGNTDCVEAAAGANRFSILGNDMNGSATLWGLNANGVRIGAGCTNFKVCDNDVGDCSGNGIIDGSTNAEAAKKVIRDNI